MILVELAVWMPVGYLWGMFANVVLGIFFPWPSLIWVAAYLVWSYTPWADTHRDWLYERIG